MFLLSLIPEVEHFNNDQIKLFIYKIFNVIDNILVYYPNYGVNNYLIALFAVYNFISVNVLVPVLNFANIWDFSFVKCHRVLYKLFRDI